MVMNNLFILCEVNCWRQPRPQGFLQIEPQFQDYIIADIKNFVTRFLYKKRLTKNLVPEYSKVKKLLKLEKNDNFVIITKLYRR